MISVLGHGRSREVSKHNFKLLQVSSKFSECLPTNFNNSSCHSRSAHGVIIVYDITKRPTFLSLQKWINEVRNYTANNVVCALVGNKCDLTAEREVSTEEAEEVCNLIPEILFQIETSAKENTNVENAFARIAEELMVSNQQGLR